MKMDLLQNNLSLVGYCQVLFSRLNDNDVKCLICSSKGISDDDCTLKLQKGFGWKGAKSHLSIFISRISRIHIEL